MLKSIPECKEKYDVNYGYVFKDNSDAYTSYKVDNHIVNTIVKAKPTVVKGKYITNISISSTMGPGIKVDQNSFDK